MKSLVTFDLTSTQEASASLLPADGVLEFNHDCNVDPITDSTVYAEIVGGKLVDREGREGVWLEPGPYKVTISSQGSRVTKSIEIPSAVTPLSLATILELGSASESQLSELSSLTTNYNSAANAPLVYPTVVEMKADSPSIGSLVRTVDYRTVNDGGGNLYEVIAAVDRTYDISGTGRAYRPVLDQHREKVIYPKKFGTVNDGASFDNSYLQAAYDFAHDNSISVIDGGYLRYTIGPVNPYDQVNRGFAHMGAYIYAGMTLRNASFKLSPSATAGTCAVTVRLDPTRSSGVTVLKNIDIDGSLPLLPEPIPNDPAGREDGGCHGVHLWHPDIDPNVDPSVYDFMPSGDVVFEAVRIRDTYSYGVRIDHLDCTVTYVDCEWDTCNIAAQMHALRNIVRGCSVRTYLGRVEALSDAFHVELEFGGSYGGSKKPSVRMEDIRHVSEVSWSNTFKIHHSPSLGLDWADISLDRVNQFGKEHCYLVEIFTTNYMVSNNTDVLNIEVLSVHDSSSDQPVLAHFSSGSESKRISIDSFDIINKRKHNVFVSLNTDFGRV